MSNIGCLIFNDINRLNLNKTTAGSLFSSPFQLLRGGRKIHKNVNHLTIEQDPDCTLTTYEQKYSLLGNVDITPK